jgi:citronellol/citronellal dehydrogenase
LLLARLGAHVVICGRTVEKLERVAAFANARSASIRAFPTDIRRPEQIESLFLYVHNEFGRLDILINNAGGQFPQAAIDFSVNGWKAVIDNNLHGTWLMMQRAARYWRDQETPGSIVNVVVVSERGMPGIAHTVAARAGVIGASRTVAVEWAPLAIRVNCVAPGLIATSGLEVYPPEARREFPRANPMKRPGTPMDIAQACIYLSAPSGRFITGEVLTVDGGGRLWGELWTAGRPDYYRTTT